MNYYNQEWLGRRRFPDNKSFRRTLYESSLSVLQEMMNLIASNYPSSSTDTNFSIFFRIVAREIARLKYSENYINDNKQYLTTDPKLLQQVLGERLYLGSKIAPIGYNDESYRNYLVSIKDAYLKGSLKTNIEALASKFTGQTVILHELYLDARHPFSSVDITSTNMMVVDVLIDNVIRPGYDLSLLTQDLNFFVNLVKPAHVLYDTRLIWTELIDVNKTHDILFGDLGGGCIPVYDYIDFSEYTGLAQLITILPSIVGATGMIDSLHHLNQIVYLSNGNRYLCEPGLKGTKIYDASGRQVSFDALSIGSFVKIVAVTIPGDFQFWYQPPGLIPSWASQFYKDIYRRPAFQENVKKIMDSKGRFPLQIRTTETTICDRWVQDAMQPYYEDLRGVCDTGVSHETDYSSVLSLRMGSPRQSWPYASYEIHDSYYLGSDYVFFMGRYPLTDGSSHPATIADISVSLDGTNRSSAILSLDASSGRINLTDTTAYWDATRPFPGNELIFNYHYLSDGSNYDATTSQIFGIGYWQMPQVPMVQSDGTLAGIYDATVSVDTTVIRNAIIYIDPILGHVNLQQSGDFWRTSELGYVPQIDATFDFTYYVGDNYEYPMLLDDPGRRLDDVFLLDGAYGDASGIAPILPADPLEIGYRYRGVFLHHSSVLNSPDTLELNTFQKPANRASIANKQETLNNFNIFFSPEFLYDSSALSELNDRYLDNGLDPILKLREGTPPFQETLASQPGLVYQRKLQDIRSHHHPLFYSGLLLKEFPDNGESVPLSTICDSDRDRFKVLIKDNIQNLHECSEWIYLDTIDTEMVEINIDGEVRGVPNLRVSDKLIRSNFILREVESTGTAEFTHTVTLPINEMPPTTFMMPESFPYEYNDEIFAFPALPMVDAEGNLADTSSVSVTVNGIPWPVTAVNPLTGEVQIAPYPTDLIVEHEFILTAADVAARHILLPGYPIDPTSVSLRIIGSSAQLLNYDFLILGQYLSWVGTTLHDRLNVGDIIRISATVNPYVGATVSFVYHIQNYYTTRVINRSAYSRFLDNGYVMDGCSEPSTGIMFDPDYRNLAVTWEEYISFVDDYSDGIKLTFFNTTTSQIEEHIFTGPVFEHYEASADELGSPDNFPNAMVRLNSPLNFAGNPLTFIVDYGFINDKIVRFRKKTFQELLPSRTFRTLNLVEMLPV